MDGSNLKNKVKLFNIKSLRGSLANNSEPAISSVAQTSADCTERRSLDEELSTSNRSRAQTIFRSIKQKLKFKKSKLTICKTKQKVSTLDSMSCNGAFPSAIASDLQVAQAGHADDCRLSVISAETPPAVPPRPLFTFEEGQYIDIPVRTQPSRSISSHMEEISDFVRIINARQSREQIDVLPDDYENSAVDNSNVSLHDAILDLTKYGWYWGPISRRVAVEKLENQPDGSFLVRDSSSSNYIFSLSFRSWGRTLHTRIDYKCGKYAIMDQQGFSSISSLIAEGMKKSKDAIYCYSRSRGLTEPMYPVRLTKPVSRFTQVRSLQYLCRFVIRQYMNVNNIKKLPIPTTLQGYLEQGHFF